MNESLEDFGKLKLILSQLEKGHVFLWMLLSPVPTAITKAFWFSSLIFVP